MATYRLVSSTGEQAFELPPGRSLVVGRGVASDIAIYDPTISRRHAELIAEADGVEVRDLGSSNGTCINGSRVTAGRLRPNDSVTFGKVLFRLRPLAPLPADAVPPPFEQPPTGDNIVRQMEVSGGLPPGITSRDGPAQRGQLRVAAATAEERQAKKLSLLLTAAQKLSSELDLDRLLRVIVDVTFEVMNVDRVSILLPGEAGGELVPRISKSRLGDTQLQQVPRSIVDKVVQDRVAVVSHNAPADARFKGRSILMQSVRSAMCSPLMASADQVLGILYVDNLTDANTFTDEDLQFLVAFSGLAAIGIKNSRFADQLQRETIVRSNFERYFAPNVAADIVQQDGGHPARRGAPRGHRTLQRHSRLHRDRGGDGTRRHRADVERVFHRDGGGDLRARRHAGQVHRRRDHGPLGRSHRARGRSRPRAPGRRRDAAQHRRAEPSLGGRGPPRDRGGDGDQLRGGLRREHRQPPAPGIHSDRRRGERRQPPLRRGRRRRDPGERAVVAGGEERGGRRFPAGARPQG